MASAIGTGLATGAKLVEQISASRKLVETVLNKLKLSPIGDFATPENGRIASNIIVTTLQQGDIMLRFYPAGCQSTKLETGNVEFEVEALTYLKSKGVNVPSPMRFDSGKTMEKIGDVTVFAYKLLPGEPLEQNIIGMPEGPKFADKSSLLLREIISKTSDFSPTTENPPEGDIQYLLSIYEKLLERYPILKESRELSEMKEWVKKPEIQKLLEKTPKGLVHADFFFENILFDKQSGTYGLIDFGDVYYGHIVMDIVIGAMEFAVMEDGTWNQECFEAFLRPHIEWLKSHNINFDLFYDLLIVNCFRFSIYLMKFTLDDGKPVTDNPYVARFKKLQGNAFRDKLRSLFDNVLKGTDE